MYHFSVIPFDVSKESPLVWKLTFSAAKCVLKQETIKSYDFNNDKEKKDTLNRNEIWRYLHSQQKNTCKLLTAR